MPSFILGRSMKIQLNRYWKCQLIGWFIAVTSNFLLQLLRPDVNVKDQLLANFLFMGLGILSTHGLRWSYRKLQVIDMPLLQMSMPIMCLSLLATTAVIVCMFSVIILVMPDSPSLFNMGTIFSNLLGIYPIILIWSFLYLCIQYLRRWRQSEVDKVALAHALKDAQLNTLIGQINPHFMFNALNNIRALMLEDVPKARESMTLLAKVLRYGLAAPKQSFVSLQSELDTVSDFVALAKIQYEHRLEWHLDVAVDAQRYQVPPMMIQMLVENAIKHGIARVKHGGELKLHIQREQQQLLIQVMNPGQLQRAPYAEESTGLGLCNISQRLALLFNDAASFHLDESPLGVVAELRIPCIAENVI
jgi:two-component system LytT family sensor kinase